MGIILSGANADGAAGLKAVANAGGLAVVQSLETAEMIAMPAAALEAVPDSIEVDAEELAELLRVHGEMNGG
jgi:two-component system chemotaxis response regulator CheB